MKKLALNKETLVRLESLELDAVNGGGRTRVIREAARQIVTRIRNCFGQTGPTTDACD